MDLRKRERLAIRFEALLGIAGVLALIGSLAPWEAIGTVAGNALQTWQGNLAFVGGLLVIFATVVNYGVLMIEELESLSPYIDGGLGILGSLLILIGVFAFPIDMSPGTSLAWGIYLSGGAGFLALFSAYMVYEKGSPSIPRGFARKGITP